MSIQGLRVQKDLMTNPNAWYPVGSHTENTTLNTAQTLTLPDGANGFIIQASVQNIRYTVDGTAPTSTKGFLIRTTDYPVILYAPSNNSVFRFIEVTASATLEYQAIRLFGCE